MMKILGSLCSINHYININFLYGKLAVVFGIFLLGFVDGKVIAQEAKAIPKQKYDLAAFLYPAYANVIQDSNLFGQMGTANEKLLPPINFNQIIRMI